MAFDIYGENLRRGHCEVHPHVHEEYPCSVCIAEAEQREQRQGRDEQHYLLGQAQQRIEELEAKNRRLQAENKRLKRLAVYIYNSGYSTGHEDIVEGRYTDVVPVDFSTYDEDVVADTLLEQDDEQEGG